MNKLLLCVAVITFHGCRSGGGSSSTGIKDVQAGEITLNSDNCLGDQDMDLEDVDISRCPVLPSYPERARLGATENYVSLGAWELGTTTSGENYKYGTLTVLDTGAKVLSYGGGSDSVNDDNIACWAKGYYRLRRMLQNPPAEYMKLYAQGFQTSFFQFQTDLRNGDTGFMKISSYQDHLVKWVTLIDRNGTCIQPTLKKFKNYAAQELVRRGIRD